MPAVISDSSPLINLAGIGRWGLLHEMFSEIIIPPSVWDEIATSGDILPGAAEVREACGQGWISRKKPDNNHLVNLLCQDLHRGEAEAIVLALELNADLILLDETDARRVAATFGLRKTGVIGILMRAKREGTIDSLRFELNALRERMGFYIDDQLYCRALASVEEYPDPE
ncbi:DUF3368 domain-containing protein [Methanoregula sp.]|uniref:DUF3368 domain-containing protein n=1 Tax=Methanoregula sp. TaxID=2052170 RepID=UPI0026330093|nr:DUF3368 domain-containing protein [Methanoregula sp.]MDD5144043.1 DUF3368 domain-containing protein [Methanoregula sp.]